MERERERERESERERPLRVFIWLRHKKSKGNTAKTSGTGANQGNETRQDQL